MLFLFAIVFIDLIGFGIAIPLLPFYAESLNADPFVVGLVMATYSGAQFVTAPIWGRLSDRLGRRPILLVSLFGLTLSYVWLGFAESLWMLFGARAAGGLMAGNISAAFAYMADITTRETRARGMGAIGAAFGLGFIVGPAIGGLLAGPDPAAADFRTPFFAAAALSASAWLAAVFLLKESLSSEVRARLRQQAPRKPWLLFWEFLKQPNLALLIALSFLATFVFAGLETTFALWSRRAFGWGPEQNGYVFACIGLMSAIVQGLFVGRMARALGEARLIAQGALALAAGLLLIPFATALPWLLIAVSMAAYGFSVMTPALNSLISLQVAEDEQGGVMGVTRSATILGRVAGPAWAGMLFAWLGKDWPFFVGAAAMVGVFLLAVRASKALTRTQTPATD